jgi:hypothetical protein
MGTGVEPIRGVAESTFTGPSALDRLYAAQAFREPLTLTADEVADLIEQLPDEDEYVSYDEVRARLAKLPCNALKISRKARGELAEAFGYDLEDVWPS